MNINKHVDYFNPLSDLKHPITIIGCGAIGSTVAVMLARMGIPNIKLYDFDIVTAHNIANQTFRHKDINETKPKALREILEEINPEIEVVINGEYNQQKLSGHVFLAVDNIDLRRKIATDNKDNLYIKAMYDFRMRLIDAQHYAADWQDKNSVNTFIASMQFSHEDAKAETPTNACGTSLNIITTVNGIVSLGLQNFIHYTKTGDIKKCILLNQFQVDVF